MGTGSGANFVIGFIVGVAAGVAIGIVYAPKSGLETREFLRKKFVSTGESVKEVAEELSDKAREFTDEVGGMVREVAGNREKIYKESWKRPKVKPYSEEI